MADLVLVRPHAISPVIRAKKLIPTREEGRKLFLKVWEYLLLAILAGMALLVPAIRGWLYRQAQALWAFAHHDVYIPGWLVLVLCGLALIAAVQLLHWGSALLLPAHERRYTGGHFDGIDWTWRWKKGRVLKHSLRPFCPNCQTELHVTAKGNQYGRSRHGCLLHTMQRRLPHQERG